GEPPMLSRCASFLLVSTVFAAAAGQVSPERTDRNGDPLPDRALARLGSTRLVHGNTIVGVAFSPDGKLVAAAEFGDWVTGPEGKVRVDPSIRLWDVVTGKEVRRLAVGPDLFGGPAFSPDGKTLAAPCGQAARLWDVASGKEVGRLPAEDAVWRVAFSP